MSRWRRARQGARSSPVAVVRDRRRGESRSTRRAAVAGTDEAGRVGEGTVGRFSHEIRTTAVLCRQGRLGGETWSGTAAAHLHRRHGPVGADHGRHGLPPAPTAAVRGGVGSAVAFLTAPRGVVTCVSGPGGTGPVPRSGPASATRRTYVPSEIVGYRADALSARPRTHPCTSESRMPAFTLLRERADRGHRPRDAPGRPRTGRCRRRGAGVRGRAPHRARAPGRSARGCRAAARRARSCRRR